MPLTAEVRAKVSIVQTSVADGGLPEFRNETEWVKQLLNGTAADQADMLWLDDNTLAASATTDIDLAGALASVFAGAALTFVKLVGIIVTANAANVNDVVLGAGTNTFNAFFGAAGHTIKVKPGGVFMLVAPDINGLGTVVPATGDILRITNGGAGTSVSYRVILLGRSA
jgi:hypothetical protein